MLQFSPNAKKRIENFIKDKDLNTYGISLPANDGAFFDLELFDLRNVTPNEAFMELGGIVFVFEKAVEKDMKDATIDYIPGGILPGRFVIEFKEPLPEGFGQLNINDPTVQRIQQILDRDINPSIASHGGVARMLDYKDNVLYLQMGGGCQGCSGVDATLKQGIERRLREEIPELIGVIDQTDHASGKNPYYQPGHAH